MTIKILHVSILAAVAFALTGCSMTPPKSQIDVQAGEHFILNEAIHIPAGKVKNTIQFGQLNGGGFNSTEQHCRIELYALPEKAVTINPQRFLIERVAIGDEMIAQANTSLQFATNQYANVQNDAATPMLLAFGENQRVETMDLVHLYLVSNTQPNVYRLTCAGALSNGNPFDAPRSYRPQREQINRILGTIGSIQP